MADFAARLHSGPPIVADGGLGALLAGAVPGLRCPEEANLRSPESVVAVHASYIRAGAELIETNTFRANRRNLATHLLEDEFERINSAAVRLAREAREVSGRDVFIAGAIGPLGELEMFDAADHGAALRRAGARSSKAAASTSSCWRRSSTSTSSWPPSPPCGQLLAADRGAAHVRRGRGDRRAASAPPTRRPAGAARRGRDREQPRRRPARGADRARRDARLQLPLATLPNIGLASIVGGRVVYPHSTPDYFAEFAAQASALGARMIGGCCGTTPAQIEAIRGALDERAPSARGLRGRRARAAGGRGAEPR